LAKRGYETNSMPHLKGATPTLLIEPQSQNGAGCPWSVERGPQHCNPALQASPLLGFFCRNFANLLLQIEHRADKTGIRILTALPSPAGKQSLARVTDRTRMTVPHPERNMQTPVAGGAAVIEHAAVRGTCAAFG
tara:strand:+ start:175 stop:579 length:405 start_codon:yes stop_codon:yes gene_type:complete